MIIILRAHKRTHSRRQDTQGKNESQSQRCTAVNVTTHVRKCVGRHLSTTRKHCCKGGWNESVAESDFVSHALIFLYGDLARSLARWLFWLCCFCIVDGVSEAGEIAGWNALYSYMLGVRFNFTLQTIESDSKQWLSVSACVCMRECYKEEKPMLSVIVITLWLDKIVSVTTVCVVCISNCELRARLCVCVCACV